MKPNHKGILPVSAAWMDITLPAVGRLFTRVEPMDHLARIDDERNIRILWKSQVNESGMSAFC